jgi:protein-tyrosine-phosphatase
MLSDAGRSDIEVSSAGTDAWDDGTATDEAILVGLERGLDLARHRSRKLTRELVRDSDLVLAMGPQHTAFARQMDGGDKVHLLSHYAADGESHRAIIDPFGGDLDAYRSTADDLETQVKLALDRFIATLEK